MVPKWVLRRRSGVLPDHLSPSPLYRDGVWSESPNQVLTHQFEVRPVCLHLFLLCRSVVQLYRQEQFRSCRDVGQQCRQGWFLPFRDGVQQYQRNRLWSENRQYSWMFFQLLLQCWL